MSEPVTEKYLETLLLYFEEEIMGEAYFYGLAEKFPEEHQQQKMVLLAKVERHAAEAVKPLLEKHNLKARPDSELHKLGKMDIDKSFQMGWGGYIDYIVERFPKYMPEFHALEAMAPEDDIAELKILTDHEVAAIQFANLEKTGNPDSIKPLLAYLART